MYGYLQYWNEKFRQCRDKVYIIYSCIIYYILYIIYIVYIIYIIYIYLRRIDVQNYIIRNDTNFRYVLCIYIYTYIYIYIYICTYIYIYIYIYIHKTYIYFCQQAVFNYCIEYAKISNLIKFIATKEQSITKTTIFLLKWFVDFCQH